LASASSSLSAGPPAGSVDPHAGHNRKVLAARIKTLENVDCWWPITNLLEYFILDRRMGRYMPALHEVLGLSHAQAVALLGIGTNKRWVPWLALQDTAAKEIFSAKEIKKLQLVRPNFKVVQHGQFYTRAESTGRSKRRKVADGEEEVVLKLNKLKWINFHPNPAGEPKAVYEDIDGMRTGHWGRRAGREGTFKLEPGEELSDESESEPEDEPADGPEDQSDAVPVAVPAEEELAGTEEESAMDVVAAPVEEETPAAEEEQVMDEEAAVGSNEVRSLLPLGRGCW
jgi:hypothetical protein